MGDRVNLLGYRIRVTFEATLASEGDPWYRLVANADGACRFESSERTTPLLDPSGLVEFQTQEAMTGAAGSFVFSSGPVAQALALAMKPNDFISVEIQGPGDDAYRLAFLGLASDIRETAQSSIAGIRATVQVQAEGLQKLFNQSIYNWQGVMAQGEDVILGKDTFAAFERLISKDGPTRRPDEIIQELVRIGVSNSIKALIHRKRVAPGGLFNLGPDWRSLYDSGQFPNTAALLMDAWTGSLWATLTRIAEPSLHEFFWTIRTVGGEDKPCLMHRPRPFPDGGGPGDADWLRLKSSGQFHVLGKDGAPAATGFMRSLSDGVRANAFHWGQEGFNDLNGSSPSAKMSLGWWCDKRGIAKYGFAPREVSVGLIPKEGEPWMLMVSNLLKRVAHQEAPLYLMSNESRVFGQLLPGVHVGQAIEDWSVKTNGKPTTGYLTSVSHSYKSTPTGIQVATSLGMARCLRGTTFDDYPKAVKALTIMAHVEYESGRHPNDRAKAGSAENAPSTSAAVNGVSEVRNVDEMKAASGRSGIPVWLLAIIYKNETTFGFDPKTYIEHGSAQVLGPMQISRVAVDEANAKGYRKSDGFQATHGDRTSAAVSMDLAAFYISNSCGAPLFLAGCGPDNPNYWRYVADAYNRGPAAAIKSGLAAGWGESGLRGYGKGLNVAEAQATFGGL